MDAIPLCGGEDFVRESLVSRRTYKIRGGSLHKRGASPAPLRGGKVFVRARAPLRDGRVTKTWVGVKRFRQKRCTPTQELLGGDNSRQANSFPPRKGAG